MQYTDDWQSYTGIITGAVGAITYFDCVNFDSEEVVEGSDVWLHECNKSGPAAYTAFYIDIIGFFFCSLLILTAFFMLPYSRKKGQRTLAADSPPRSFPSGMDPEVHTEGCGCLCGVKMYTNRGGALRHLLVWDVCCFVLVVAITAACVLVLRPYNLLGGGDFERFEWQFKADLFFVRALYGVLSLPFLLFVIPPFSTLFLHVIPTGYNKAGECVPMMTGKDLSEVTRQRRLRQQIANTSNRVHPVDEGDGEGREEGKERNEATAMQALVKAEEGKGNRKTAWSGE